MYVSSDVITSTTLFAYTSFEISISIHCFAHIILELSNIIYTAWISISTTLFAYTICMSRQRLSKSITLFTYNIFGISITITLFADTVFEIVSC